jgi:AcrR family transcriptional regulator
VADRRQPRGRRAYQELGPLPGGRHGLSAEQVAESQRERLLAAAAQLVAERGYKTTTITAIAKRAAVANRAFYANFATKEECVLAVVETVLDHLRDLISGAAAHQGAWPQRVLAALRAALAFFEAEPQLARLCLIAPFTSTPAIATSFTARITAGAPYLAAGRAERPENATLPESTEDSLLGGLISLTARSLVAGDRPLPDLLPELAEFVLTPYLGPAEASRLARSGA